MPIAMFRGLAAVPLLLLAACGPADEPPPPPPPEVAVATARAETLRPETVLPGRLEAWREAEVRARVSGIVQQRLFAEGSTVWAGQPLYVIDPAPYRAELARAEAELARAEAQRMQADSQARRVERLFKTGAISEQAAVDARAAARVAEAAVAAATAERDEARIRLDYTRVTAPIGGRIGRALVTEGALVSENEATPLALIQQTDPLYASFTQSAADVLALRRQAAEIRLPASLATEAEMLQSRRRQAASDETGLTVTLLLEDGQPYRHTGRLLFADLRVDPQTARVLLRAQIPNPDGVLLPGLPVRVRLQQSSHASAFAIPQQAITRDESGDFMKVLDAANRVQTRRVQVLRAMGNDWLVTDGLADGERFVVEGFQKIRPDAPVTPIPWQR